MTSVSRDTVDQDEGILPRVALREPGSMKECIEKFSGLVWSITRRYVREKSDCEDVVQEIFTELWQKAERFDDKKSSEATFIGLVARRRSIDWLRRHSRQPKMELITANVEFDQPQEEPISLRHDTENIRLAIKKLSENAQELFRLHFEIGMTHPEIADQTGIPLGTVKTQLRRGLIQLRSAMGQGGQPYKIS